MYIQGAIFTVGVGGFPTGNFWHLTWLTGNFSSNSRVIVAFDTKFPSLTKYFFLWQEISSSVNKFLPLTRNSFLWQEISSSKKKFLALTENFFLRQKISSSVKKFLPLSRNFFLGHQISSSDNKFLPLENKFGAFLNILCPFTFLIIVKYCSLPWICHNDFFYLF